LTITIDGVAVTHAIAGGANTLALAVVNINTQFGAAGVTASTDTTGKIVLTSSTKGANSSIAVSGAAAATLFGASTATAGVSRTAQSVADALNTGFAADAELTKAGLQATISGTQITVASQNGTFFRVNTRGANAYIGFGITGVTFTGNTINVANNTALDANGTSNTTAISYAALAYGNSDQAITISANDAAGAIQTRTITLQNDSTTVRNGRSIDESINYINSQLQQSNNSTLQKIVAVKENVGHIEKINFISSLGAFTVGVGSSANADGLNSGAAATKDSA